MHASEIYSDLWQFSFGNMNQVMFGNVKVKFVTLTCCILNMTILEFQNLVVKLEGVHVAPSRVG